MVYEISDSVVYTEILGRGYQIEIFDGGRIFKESNGASNFIEKAVEMLDNGSFTTYVRVGGGNVLEVDRSFRQYVKGNKRGKQITIENLDPELKLRLFPNLSRDNDSV